MMQRQNCVLLSDEFKIQIRDLGSMCGIFVNGRHIGVSTIVVLHNDLIEVGGATFMLEIEPIYANRPLPS